MSVTITPPPTFAPPKKKSGLGCLGCGCGAVALIVVLIIGLTVAGCYVLYQKALALTSTTPGDIPVFAGDSSVYTEAQQKVAAFQADLKDHKPSSIHLNSDEINSMIAANPDAKKNNVRVFVTLTNDEARIQASVPVDKMIKGVGVGRFFNFDSNFGVSFDSGAKAVEITPHTLQVGDRTLMGPNADNGTNPSDAAFNQSFMRSFAPSFNQSFNQGLRGSAGGADVLDHAKDIEVKNGELVIETQ